MASNFAAQVADWVAQSKVALEEVFHESAQRVKDDMLTTRNAGGNLPIDTGFLRASLMASNEAMPQIREDAKPTPGTTYAYDPGPVSLVISNTPLGGKVYLGFVAMYSAMQEFGTGKTPARLFVTLAAQKWVSIVAQVQNELAGRLGR